MNEFLNKYYNQQQYFNIINKSDVPKYLDIEINQIKTQLSIMKRKMEFIMPYEKSKLLNPMKMKKKVFKPKKVKNVNISVKRKFNSLVNKWKEETQFSSTVLEMSMNSNYQQIIGLGPNVIPLILERLSKNNEHWFWALKAITGESPVSEQSKGIVTEMAQAWLSWARKKGYEY